MKLSVWERSQSRRDGLSVRGPLSIRKSRFRLGHDTLLSLNRVWRTITT